MAELEPSPEDLLALALDHLRHRDKASKPVKEGLDAWYDGINNTKNADRAKLDLSALAIIKLAASRKERSNERILQSRRELFTPPRSVSNHHVIKVCQQKNWQRNLLSRLSGLGLVEAIKLGSEYVYTTASKKESAEFLLFFAVDVALSDGAALKHILWPTSYPKPDFFHATSNGIDFSRSPWGPTKEDGPGKEEEDQEESNASTTGPDGLQGLIGDYNELLSAIVDRLDTLAAHLDASNAAIERSSRLLEATQKTMNKLEGSVAHTLQTVKKIGAETARIEDYSKNLVGATGALRASTEKLQADTVEAVAHIKSERSAALAALQARLAEALSRQKTAENQKSASSRTLELLSIEISAFLRGQDNG